MQHQTEQLQRTIAEQSERIDMVEKLLKNCQQGMEKERKELVNLHAQNAQLNQQIAQLEQLLAVAKVHQEQARVENQAALQESQLPLSSVPINSKLESDFAERSGQPAQEVQQMPVLKV